MSPADNICPYCGARAASFGGSGGRQQVAYVKELPAGERPTFATALTGLAVIGAVASFLLAGSYKLIPSIGALSSFASAFGALASAMPYFLGFVGIISLGAAYGFLKGKHWAWKLGALVSVLEIITLISPNLIGFTVGIISLYLLSTRHVKSWLRK